MDWILAGSEFRIKNYRQVLQSVFSFLRVPSDKVCAFFVMKQLPAICGELERFVTAVRLIYPRCDRAWNDKLRADSPLAYKALDVIRRWNIFRIAYAVGGLQNRPGDVLISDLEQLVRWICRPFLILDAIGANECFPAILNDFSQQIVLDDDGDAAQEETVEYVARLYRKVSREVRYELYPLLVKMLGKMWCGYEEFFGGQ